MVSENKKTLGQAIDEIIAAVGALDEPARATAIRAACEHLGLSVVGLGAANRGETAADQQQVSASTTVQAGAVALHDIRSFKELKGPANAMEMAVVVSYFLATLASPADRKSEIGAADLEKYFKQGGFPLPRRMPQLLVDARAAGYFDSAGHGKYKLNPVGHNLVAHKLPKKKSK